MARTYEVLKASDEGRITVLHTDEDGTQFKTTYNLPMKDDGSAYTENDLDEFITDRWPVYELEALRQKNSPSKDPFDVVKQKIQVPKNVDQKLKDKKKDKLKDILP